MAHLSEDASSTRPGRAAPVREPPTCEGALEAHLESMPTDSAWYDAPPDRQLAAAFDLARPESFPYCRFYSTVHSTIGYILSDRPITPAASAMERELPLPRSA